MLRSTICRLSLIAEVMIPALDFVPIYKLFRQFTSAFHILACNADQTHMGRSCRNQALLRHVYCPLHMLPMPLAHPLYCHRTGHT